MNLTEPLSQKKLVRQREVESGESVARWWWFAAPELPGSVITIPYDRREREREKGGGWERGKRVSDSTSLN